MRADSTGSMALRRRVGFVAVGTVTTIFWVLGLYSGSWALRQLGPSTFGNRTVVFGQAASPWFTAAGLLTIALLVAVIAFRPPRDA